MMKTQTKPECPNGKAYGRNPRKKHCMVDVSRTRLAKDDPRGDWHVVSKCKWCGLVEEYDCIYGIL